MSQDLERVYTINLGKVLLSQSQHRAVRAINMIKEFARHHMKVEEIKIEEDLAHIVWARGMRSPPRRIRVRMSKTDEGYVLVSPYDEDAPVPEKEAANLEDKPGQAGAPDAESEAPSESADGPEAKPKELDTGAETKEAPKADKLDAKEIDADIEPKEDKGIDKTETDTGAEPPKDAPKEDTDGAKEPDVKEASKDTDAKAADSDKPEGSGPKKDSD